jgi:hypothetical protein
MASSGPGAWQQIRRARDRDGNEDKSMLMEFLYAVLIAGFILLVLIGHAVLLKPILFPPRNSRSPDSPATPQQR